jgi:excisionase family DNA binding protein
MLSDASNGDGLLKKLEAAKLLQISPRTLDLWIKKRRVPYIKFGTTKGSLVRFKRTDLENMLRRFTIESQSEVFS